MTWNDCSIREEIGNPTWKGGLMIMLLLPMIDDATRSKEFDFLQGSGEVKEGMAGTGPGFPDLVDNSSVFSDTVIKNNELSNNLN